MKNLFIDETAKYFYFKRNILFELIRQQNFVGSLLEGIILIGMYFNTVWRPYELTDLLAISNYSLHS